MSHNSLIFTIAELIYFCEKVILFVRLNVEEISDPKLCGSLVGLQTVR